MRFTVPGVPVPKARPRFTRTGNTYTPAKTVAHEAAVMTAYRAAGGNLLQGALRVEIELVMPIPKSTPKKLLASLLWHRKRPDVDNLAKTVLDALNGVAYGDDGQVCWLVVMKTYGQEPHTEITIEELKHGGELDVIRK